MPQVSLLIDQVETEVTETEVHLRANVYLQIEIDPAQIAAKATLWDTGFQFLAGFENGPLFRTEQLVYQAYDHSLQLDIQIPDDIPTDTGILAVCVLSEEYIGCDVEQRIELKKLFEPATTSVSGKAQRRQKTKRTAAASTTDIDTGPPAQRNRV